MRLVIITSWIFFNALNLVVWLYLAPKETLYSHKDPQVVPYPWQLLTPKRVGIVQTFKNLNDNLTKTIIQLKEVRTGQTR